MRYVIQEHYDDLHQECKGFDCSWRSGPYDEAFSTCPVCGSGLKEVGPDA